ncbi:MAG TPA: toll/interleukin-1 receptor domain-containing protein, partial [Polyangia bacterium]|nr:toll/interleukin-1 receptor domain-containing protein [Polyangia bacterium]
HLAPLRRQGLIGVWHDRQIDAGTEWQGAIDEELERADVILMLVSPNFVASDYCYDVEMKRAMERHGEGTARVIPIVVRPVDFGGLPLGRLQALPRDARPVTAWGSRDEAWLDVAKGIRQVVEAKRAS